MTETGVSPLCLRAGTSVAGVLRILAERPQVQDGAQPRGGAVFAAHVHRFVSEAARAVADRELVGHRAVGRRDAHVVEESDVVVGVFVGLVELLRGGGNVQLQAAAEALQDGAGVFGKRVGGERDQGGGAGQAAGRDADYGCAGGNAVPGELDTAARVEPHLKGLAAAEARIGKLGHLRPGHHQAALFGQHPHAAGGGGGVQVIEQRRDARGAGCDAPGGAVRRGVVGFIEGQVAVRIDVHLAVGLAVKREGEGDRDQAGVIVAEPGEGCAVGSRAGIVAALAHQVAVHRAAAARVEGEGAAVQVELIAAGHYAVGVFEDGDVARVAAGCGRRGQLGARAGAVQGPVAQRLPVEEPLLAPPARPCAADGLLLPRYGGGSQEDRQADERANPHRTPNDITPKMAYCLMERGEGGLRRKRWRTTCCRRRPRPRR